MDPISANLIIESPRYVVWDALADIEAVVEWNPGIDDVECLSDLRSGVGARRRCFTHPSGWMTESITRWVEGELIVFNIEDAAPLKNGIASFELADEGIATRLIATFDYEVKLGPLGPVIDKLIVHKQLMGAWRRALEGLREFTEAHWQTEGIGSASGV